jgi:histidinol dehydrogenase
VRATREGLTAVADDVQTLATVEGLPAHARSVALRQSLPAPQDVP